MFDAKRLREASRLAAETLDFEDARNALEVLRHEVEEAGDLLVFQKAKFLRDVDDALSLLIRRAGDPDELFEALRGGLLADHKGREVWVRSVFENTEATVGKPLLGEISAARSRSNFESGSLIRAASDFCGRLELFVRLSDDPVRTQRSCYYHKRQMQSLPSASLEVDNIVAQIEHHLPELATLKELPRLQLVQRSLVRIGEVLQNRSGTLDERTSYVSQIVLLSIRGHSEQDAEVASSDAIEKLEEIEREFARVRFKSSTTVYLETYRPQLQRLEESARTTNDFGGIRGRLNALRELSKKAKTAFHTSGRGRFGISNFHAKQVRDEIAAIEAVIDGRQHDLAAMCLDLRDRERESVELAKREVIGRGALESFRDAVARTTHWLQASRERFLIEQTEAAQLCQLATDFESSKTAVLQVAVQSIARVAEALGDDVEASEQARKALERLSQRVDSDLLQRIRTLTAKGVRFGEVIAQRVDGLAPQISKLATLQAQQYAKYRQQLEEEIAGLKQEIPQAADLRAIEQDLRSMYRELTDTAAGISPDDAAALRRGYDECRRLFELRLQDDKEIGRQCEALDKAIGQTAQRLWRIRSLDELQEKFEELRWRVGQLAPDQRRAYQRQLNTMTARMRGIRARHGTILQEKTENLEALVHETVAAAKSNPSHPSTWEELVDVNRQIQSATLPTPERRKLADALDVGFALVKARRQEFAHQAAIVFCEYSDSAQNIQSRLETTDPPAGRNEAFEAIAQLKPLREKLKNEKRLLARHRDELHATLRNISRTVDELLDKASAAMERELLAIQTRIEGLREGIKQAGSSVQVAVQFATHRDLSRLVATSDLPVQGRRECRSQLSALFEDLIEKKEAFGRNRFTAENIAVTLARLESQGHFQWGSGVPRIA